MARRFTEAEKLAALNDLKNGMTLEQASKKHKCSSASLMQWKKVMGGGVRTARGKARAKFGGASMTRPVQTDRLMELEDENKLLRNENQSLRSLMLDRYIAKEPHPKLRLIAQTLRETGRNQVQRIMEIILVTDAEGAAIESNEHESAADSNESNGLPRHPSGTVKLRRKADQEA